VVLITDHLSGNGFKPTWTLAKVLSHVKGKDGVIRGLELKSTSGYTIQRPLELCRDLEIVKQSVEESSTPQPGIQSAETNTLDDVATTSVDGSTPTGDATSDDEEDSTTSQQMQHKAQRGTQRQAAKNASAINKIVQEEEHYFQNF